MLRRVVSSVVSIGQLQLEPNEWKENMYQQLSLYKVSHLSYHTNKHHANVGIDKYTNPMDLMGIGFQVSDENIIAKTLP